MNAPTHEPPETAVLKLPAERVKLAVEKLDFYYGQTQALHGVSVGFAKNAVTAEARARRLELAEKFQEKLSQLEAC